MISQTAATHSYNRILKILNTFLFQGAVLKGITRNYIPLQEWNGNW